MKDLGLPQLIIVLACLGGVTALGITGDLPSEVVASVFTGALAGALGYVNGKKKGAE